MDTVFYSESGRRLGCVAIAVLVLICGVPSAADEVPDSRFECENGATLASGDPDPAIFADEASRGVRAFWCERYDDFGMTTKSGPYWETYSNGRPRTQASYVDSRLKGPVTIRNEDGTLFAEGFLEAGEWSGPLEIYHANGAVWFEARFEDGQLDGDLRTRFPDGALESETRYQAGREDGLARSFYPTAVGGRLKSEAHVEADQVVGEHRLLDSQGRLRRTIESDAGPATWRGAGTDPAAPDLRKHDLRD